MYEISVEEVFSAAHCLRGHKGKCEALHGHNWKVEAAICSEGLDELGLVLDFQELKAKLKSVLDKFDHGYLNELPPFDRINPSSENMARHICEELQRIIGKPGVKIVQVNVWESPGSRATFRP